jgi:hypothetical protein
LSVDSGESQDAGAVSEGTGGEDLLRRERGFAAFALWIGRRVFIDPFAVAVAVDAGGADVDEATDVGGESGEDVRDPAGVNVLDRSAGGAVEAHGEKHRVDRR